MSTPRRLWVTRTQPQADATAASLRAIGFEPVVQPVLEVRALSHAVIDPTGVDAIAFTSGHAVRAFAETSEILRDLPVFTVGEATAALAGALGFARVTASKGDVAALARLIADRDPRPAIVLNPTAREPAANLGALLAERGVEARAVAVYDTVASALAAFPEHVDGVLIYSPKAAWRVADLVGAEGAGRLGVYAISEAAAAPLRRLPFAAIATAPLPTEADLLNLLKC